MRYAIVIEQAGSNYSAYAPDLPGCVATGNSIADVEARIREAIVFKHSFYCVYRKNIVTTFCKRKG